MFSIAASHQSIYQRLSQWHLHSYSKSSNIYALRWLSVWTILYGVQYFLVLKYLKWMKPYSYTSFQDVIDVYISMILVYSLNCGKLYNSSLLLQILGFPVVILKKSVLSGMLLPDSKEIMLCPSFSLCRLLNGIELPCLVHLFTARCRLNNRRFIA